MPMLIETGKGRQRKEAILLITGKGDMGAVSIESMCCGVMIASAGGLVVKR